MKAAQINKYGGIEVIEITENVETPPISEEQILVAIKAAGLNPFDWKIRAGYLKEMMPLQFPVTLGGDFAGVIEKVGGGVSDYKIGDEVFGSAIILGSGSGAFAEFAAVNAAKVALKPKSINYLEAASLPLAGVSAIQALEDHINLQSSQRILIHGGAGGIGHIAIQIAKARGAYVATTTSHDDLDFVKKLGADQAIDYKNEKFEELLKDFDAVFDTVGGQTTELSFKILKKGGVLVSMMGKPDEKSAEKYGVTVVGQGTSISSRHLKRLAELTDEGKVAVNIDKTFSLNQTKDAFQHLEDNHPRGKVVLRIKD